MWAWVNPPVDLFTLPACESKLQLSCCIWWTNAPCFSGLSWQDPYNPVLVWFQKRLYCMIWSPSLSSGREIYNSCVFFFHNSVSHSCYFKLEKTTYISRFTRRNDSGDMIYDERKRLLALEKSQSPKSASNGSFIKTSQTLTIINQQQEIKESIQQQKYSDSPVKHTHRGSASSRRYTILPKVLAPPSNEQVWLL